MCETSSCHLKAPCSIHGVDSAVSTQTFCFSFSLLTPRPFAFCSFIPVSTLSYISYKRFAPLPRPCCPVLVHTNHSSQPTSVLCFGPHWFVFTVLFELTSSGQTTAEQVVLLGMDTTIHSSIHPTIEAQGSSDDGESACVSVLVEATTIHRTTTNNDAAVMKRQTDKLQPAKPPPTVLGAPSSNYYLRYSGCSKKPAEHTASNTW